MTSTTSTGISTPGFRTVDTRSGRLRGQRTDGVASFLGIRYAEAPVGPRRFRPPVPADPWTGERDALAFGASAIQPRSPLAVFPGPREEDCLFLNVWAPDPDGGALDEREAAAVMVWFHGGAFTSGSSSIAWYDGTHLAERGVVVVSANYRLGPLGFCHLEALGGEDWRGAANLGLLDQAAALAWVRDHIAAFGGDPDRVTIFGESAGGMSVSAQLALPASRGTFGRAIAQSGAARHVHSAETGERVARAVLDAVGVRPDDLRSLLDVDAQRFADCQADLVPRDRAEFPLPFMPTVDGSTLPVTPYEAVAAGSSAGVELICGTNAEEMRLFTMLGRMAGELEEERLLRRVARAMSRAGLTDPPEDMVATYRDRLGDAAPDDVWVAISSDLVFRIPAIEMAEAQHAHGDTRMYLFTHPSSQFGGLLGAAHAIEIPFVFDNLDRPGTEALLGDVTPARARLARDMADAWVGFARSGAPEGSLADWPLYDPGTRTTMILDVAEGSSPGPHPIDDPWAAERRRWQ